VVEVTAAQRSLSIEIDEFTLADYAEVRDLWRRSDLLLRPSDERDAVELKLARDPDLFLVARTAGTIVATVMGGWDGRRAYVYHLAVDPGHRRRGIAGALMDELEERFRGKGALKVKLQILTGNDASLAFFEQRGYELETPCRPVGKQLVEGDVPYDWGPAEKEPAT
jgi:ribosomal protein S18 acetylase RimI-like enzyme